MEFLTGLTVLNIVLISGITWLSGLFVWLLKKFITSYDTNTKVLTTLNETIRVMDKKLDVATEVDREILLELAKLRN